jgi:hypothetical protein
VTFDSYIGIDYSGASTPTTRLGTLQVYAAIDGEPQPVTTPAAPAGKRWNWTRAEIAAWLVAQAQSGRSFLAGIDHGFSFPTGYFERFQLESWPEFLEDFAQHWPTDEANTYVDFVREGITGNGAERTGHAKEWRLTERWTSSAKSVFHFDVQGSVAKSTHAGLPWLLHLRRELGEKLHCWPFDGWEVPGGKSVVAEVFPSVFRNRYPREERTVDQQDAYATARWLREVSERGELTRYLDPPLLPDERRRAELEGWILGIT